MNRLLYRCLIALHPTAFRDQFADEMLWIFDESSSVGTLAIFSDGFVSLARQWLLRSNIWKFSTGAVISGLLIVGFEYSLQVTVQTALQRANSHRAEEVQRRLLAGTVFDANFDTLSKAAIPVISAWTARPAQSSPRLAALELQLESGDRGAVEKFWQDAVQSGTPMFDRADGNRNDVIATFVWRGDETTESVKLLVPLTDSTVLSDLPLTRFHDTDIWYGSWEMNKDFRFIYCVVVNLKSGKNDHQLATVDPLNPRKLQVALGGPNVLATELSVAAAPFADVPHSYPGLSGKPVVGVAATAAR